jgi:hypothetical protein
MNDSSYMAGYQYALTMVQRFPDGWRNLGLFTFKGNRLWEAKGVFLAPEQPLVALATREKKEKQPILLLLDANRQHAFQITKTAGFAALRRVLEADSVNTPVFRFGTSGNGEFDALPAARIGLEWLGDHPAALAQVVEDISPLRKSTDIESLTKSKHLNDIDNVVDLLQRWLGPPTLIDDIRQQLRGTDEEGGPKAKEIADEAVQTATNPTLMLFRGAKYVYSFAKILSRRHQKEQQEMLEQWQNSVEEAYTPEKVSEFVAERTSVPEIVRALQERGLCILLNTTYETYYDVFLIALLAQLVDASATAQVPLTIILDGAAYLLKSRYAKDFVLHLGDRGAAWRTACFIHTYDPPEEEPLQELTRAFLEEAAVIFDVAPEYFEFAFKDLAVSQRAWLLRRFEEIALLQQRGKLGYLTYNKQSPTPWTLMEVKAELPQQVLSRLHAARRALASLKAMTIDRLAAKILGEKRMPSEEAQEQDKESDDLPQS